MCSRRHILSHPHSALPTHDNGKLLVRDQMIFAFHVGFQITAPTYGAGLVRHFIHACKNTGLAGKIVNPGKNLIAKSGFPTLKMVFYKKSRKYAHSYPLPTYISPLNNEQTAIASSKFKAQSSKVQKFKAQSSKFKSSKLKVQKFKVQKFKSSKFKAQAQSSKFKAQSSKLKVQSSKFKA